MPDFYLGKPGNLTKLPAPMPDISFSRVRGASTVTSLNGNRMTHYASAFGRRSWDLEWSQMTEDEYYLLDEFFSGQRGKGPWYFVDPSRRNILVPQQASATDVLVTGDELDGFAGGFAIDWDSGETLASSGAFVLQGTRSLAWQLPFPTTAGFVNLTSPRTGWPGYPVAPDLIGQQTFSVYTQCPIAAEVGCALYFYTSDGAFVTSVIGSTTILVADTWTRVTMSTSTPATAAYMVPLFFVMNVSITSATTVYLDKLQLEYTAAATNWQPGQGAPLVSILEPSESSARYGRWETSWTLQEVGA